MPGRRHSHGSLARMIESTSWTFVASDMANEAGYDAICIKIKIALLTEFVGGYPGYARNRNAFTLSQDAPRRSEARHAIKLTRLNTMSPRPRGITRLLQPTDRKVIRCLLQRCAGTHRVSTSLGCMCRPAAPRPGDGACGDVRRFRRLFVGMSPGTQTCLRHIVCEKTTLTLPFPRPRHPLLTTPTPTPTFDQSYIYPIALHSNSISSSFRFRHAL